MKDETQITIAGMLILAGFGAFVVSTGFDGYVITSVIALLAAAMGLAFPQPGFLRKP